MHEHKETCSEKHSKRELIMRWCGNDELKNMIKIGEI